MYNQQFQYHQPASVNQTMLDSSLSFLKQLNSNELESLEKDEVRIKKLVDDCDQVRQLQSEKENLLASNKSLAEYNLSQEPKLNQAKMLLAQTYEQAVEVSKKYDNTKMLLEGTPVKTSSEVQLALLQTECAKTEEACEELAQEFTSGKLTIDSFLGKFIDMKSLSHVRKVKCDKMAETLHQISNSSQHRRQSAPTPVKKSTPFVPNYSAYINTGAGNGAPYPPYPTQGSSYAHFPMPSYGAPSSYGMPVSMPAPYPSYPGTYPQPNLH